MPIEPTTDADRQLAAAAYKKRGSGGTLTNAEQAAIKRVEKEKEERDRWRYYESIPQKHWKQMSGRQAKVINEQAARYGIPFSGAQVNLRVVVKALHDFLADKSKILARADEDDELLVGGTNSPAMERCREVKHKLLELELAEKQGRLIDREQWHVALGRFAAPLRQAAEILQRDCGEDARRILEEALDESHRDAAIVFTQTEPDAGNKNKS